MIDLDTFVTAARMEHVPWTVEDLLRVYTAALSLWERHGWTADRVGGVRPSRPGYFDAFDQSRRHPKPSDIRLQGAIEMEKMIEQWQYDREWAAGIILNNLSDEGSAHQLLGESQLGITPSLAIDLSQQFLKLLNGQYAYILRQQRRYGYYQMAPTEGDAALARPRDCKINTSWWGMRCAEAVGASLLRDIYPYSFLNEAYLSAPVGHTGQTLREWIEADPDERGELRPFTETLMEWTPPIKNIPRIREALFRAGRVFYWRFFLPTRRREGERAILADGRKNPNLMEPEPFYRPDLTAPWEAPDPIPEIYRAEHYKDKDPGLIY